MMIKACKNIYFKIIGSHHTLKMIATCKMIVATEPVYRTYCVVYPLSPDFKAFSLSILLSEVGTKFKEQENYKGIRLIELLDVFSIFST